VGKTGGDAFPHSFAPPLYFRLVLMAFENFKHLWDAQASILCLLNAFQVLFRVKQLVNNFVQRPAPGLDSCEWLGVWDGMGKYLGQWAPPVFLKLTHEQVQDLDKLVKYLQKVCCHPGNSRETQITTTCWGLAHTYQAVLFNTLQCPKGERGGNKAAGTVTGADPPAGPTAPPGQQAVTAPPTATTAATATIAGVALVSPAGTAAAAAPDPAAGIAAEPNDQPVPVAVAPVKLKMQREQIAPGGMTMSQGHRGR